MLMLSYWEWRKRITNHTWPVNERGKFVVCIPSYYSSLQRIQNDDFCTFLKISYSNEHEC